MLAQQLLRFVALIAALLFMAQPAFACIVLGELKLDGYPRDGAEDVPLDVVPIYQLTRGEYPYGIPTLLSGGWPDASTPLGALFDQDVRVVSLSHEGGSAQVSLRNMVGPHFEIVPAQPLLPHTQYTLVISWMEAEEFLRSLNGPIIEKRGSVTFRTGGTAYDGDLSAPAVFATQFFGDVGTSCDPPPPAVCFSLPDDDALYVAQFERDPLIRVERGSFFNNRARRDPEDKLDCMRIQHRAPNGTLSAPAVSCRGDWTVYDLEMLPDARDPDNTPLLGCDSQGLRRGKQLVSEQFEQAMAAEREDEEEQAEQPAVSATGAPEDDRDARAMRASGGCGLAVRRRADGSTFALLALSASIALRIRARRKWRARTARSS